MSLRLMAILISLPACLLGAKHSIAQIYSPSLQFELETMYRKGYAVEAMMKLSQTQALDPDVFGWLTQKALSGVPPFQYELSRRFQQLNIPGSLEWLAKAYVVRSLDLAECSDKTRNPVNLVLTTFYAPLIESALKEPVAYAEALERAIEWEQVRKKRPSSTWICNQAILSAEEREVARAKQLDQIRAGIGRLKSKGAGQ